MLDHNGGRGIITPQTQNFIFPGVAQLVGRQLWELEAARSNRATRTKAPLKSWISGELFFVYYDGNSIALSLIIVILGPLHSQQHSEYLDIHRQAMDTVVIP